MEPSNVDYKYILRQKDLSAWEKLVYVIIDQEQPCGIDTICKQSNLEEDSAALITKNLLNRGLIIETKSKLHYMPTFKLGKPEKKETKTKEKTTITERDKDLFLMIKKLEEYYKQRGVSYHLSKKGKKYVNQTVGYLNSCWKDKESREGFNSFSSKEELYSSYIEFTFRNMDDKLLKRTKTLIYSATRSAWVAELKRKQTTFIPVLLKRSFSDSEFFSVEKSTIPKDPKEKGYWTTVETFLLNKWQTKSYPLCKQVLYALERVIVAHIFRKQPVEDLIKKHTEYTKQYKRAEERGKLDDLMEYVQKQKKRSDICFDCNKKNDCGDYSTSSIKINCVLKNK